MKSIIKQDEPQEFINWKAMANDDWKPVYDDMGSAIKNVLKQSLMAEQGYICCYCERRLTDDDSHIEHLRPQSEFDEHSLDYANL